MRRLFAAAFALTPYAAHAGQESPEDPVSVLGATVAIVKMAPASGTALLVTAILSFAALVAWALYLFPKVAPPLAAAITMIRSGRTAREEDLERDLALGKAEIKSLEERIRVLEHRDEERRQAASAMIDTLEAHMRAAGVDPSVLTALRVALVNDPIVPRMDAVAA